jgi:acetyltransferase-like isoleucine patch superfamily enzyme
MHALVAKTLERLLRRPVKLDSGVPSGYLVARAAGLVFGLTRGVTFVRAKIVLGAGARVLASGSLTLGGGIIRIDEHCLLDCLSTNGVHLGRNFKLGAFSRLVASGTLGELGKGIRIGDNVGIGEFAYIGGAGGVAIGSDTIIGQYFSVHPENHVFSDPERSIREQGVTRQGIEIGDGCWIGAKVTVTDGVRIGRRSVVAAGTVVTRSFPDHSLIGGIPARLIRSLQDAEPTLARVAAQEPER